MLLLTSAGSSIVIAIVVVVGSMLIGHGMDLSSGFAAAVGIAGPGRLQQVCQETPAL